MLERFYGTHFFPGFAFGLYWRCGWVTVFGYGFSWKDTRRYGPSLSEHLGRSRAWRIGHYSIGKYGKWDI